jgi:hypothetical protein
VYPFSGGSGSLEVAATAQFEAWNYNLSREWLIGGAVTIGYFVVDGLSIDGEVSFLRVNQAAPDAALLTFSEVLRWYVRRRPRLSPFVEAGAGLAWATTTVPPRGTEFNYVLLAGGGVVYRLSDRHHAVAGLRWFHLSNNGRAGRDRNPDIQSLGLQMGLIFPF